MEEEIIINNIKLKLIKFRSFTYKNGKYTIFIDLKEKDEFETPAIYMFLNKNGEYSVPSKEISAELNQICLNILYDSMPFETSNTTQNKVNILPWDE